MNKNNLPETDILSQIFKNFEESTSEFLQKLSKDDKYIEAVKRLRDNFLDLKTHYDKVITQNLNNLNLPTEEIVSRLVERINLLEQKINEISNKIEKILKTI